MKYCFVVLHYKVAEITSNAIKCICESSDNFNYNIVVIDNASGNGSLETLKQEFESYSNIIFVGLSKNIGYAKGNNEGYILAKYKFIADYIIILNNDVFISQKNFCGKINELYQENEFDILGPDILTRDNSHQNPLKTCIKTLKEINKSIMITKIKLYLIPFYNIKKFFEKKGQFRYIDKNHNYKISQADVPLHGACLIYSKKYIEKHEFAFYPETFLYAEEDILFYLSRREKLKLVYSPTITVFHNEDVATNEICKTDKNKRYFQLKNSLKSLQIFKKLMKDNIS